MGTSRERYVFETDRSEQDCRDPGEEEPQMVEFFRIRMSTISGNEVRDIRGLSRQEASQLRDALVDVLGEEKDNGKEDTD